MRLVTFLRLPDHRDRTLPDVKSLDESNARIIFRFFVFLNPEIFNFPLVMTLQRPFFHLVPFRSNINMKVTTIERVVALTCPVHAACLVRGAQSGLGADL